MQPGRTIVVDDPYTYEDYSRSLRQYVARSTRKRWVRHCLWLVCMLGAVALSIALKQSYALLFVLVLFLSCAWRWYKVLAVTPRKTYESMGPITPRRFVIDESGVLRTSESSSVTIGWPDIRGLEETEDYFFLLGVSATYVLPKHCFASDTDKVDFATMVRENMQATMAK